MSLPGSPFVDHGYPLAGVSSCEWPMESLLIRSSCAAVCLSLRDGQKLQESKYFSSSELGFSAANRKLFLFPLNYFIKTQGYLQQGNTIFFLSLQLASYFQAEVFLTFAKPLQISR